MRARGVDISAVQGNPDFAKLAAGGFDFVIPKATQGAAGVDPCFIRSVEDARSAGLLVPMCYHVLTARAPIDQQIKNALWHAHAYDLDIALDFEIGGVTLTQALTFTDAANADGCRVVLYSYPYFMQPFQGQAGLALLAQKVAGYWAASYPGNQKQWPAEDANPTGVPSVFKGKWLFWQFSGDGGLSAPGIKSVVDHDVFQGTRDDLVAWMTGNKTETVRNDAQRNRGRDQAPGLSVGEPRVPGIRGSGF